MYRNTAKLGTSNLVHHRCTDVGDPSRKTPTSSSSSQVKITTFTKKSIASHSIDELNKAIVAGLATDLRPIRVVGGDGFLRIAQALIDFGALNGKQEVKNIIKHRTTLKEKYLPLVVTKAKNVLQDLLKTTSSNSNLVFTTDTWSDKYRQREFLSLTEHFIDNKWELQSSMMAVEEFSEEIKSTENIRTHILGKFFEQSNIYEIMDEAFAVTDGGSNMINIFRNHLPCMCHRLNLVIQWSLNQKAIGYHFTVAAKPLQEKPISSKKLFNLQTQCPRIKDVLVDLKKLVEFFKRSGLNKKLKVTLKQEVETRWNSQLIMLESYVASREEVRDILYQQKKLDRISKISDYVVDEERLLVGRHR